MKILILAENLEINRTSSGLRSHKQILLYKRLCSKLEVITSTDRDLIHKLEGVKYHFLKIKSSNNYKWIYKLPKSTATQNFLFGIDVKNYTQIGKWKKIISKIFHTNTYDYVVTLGSGASFIPAYALYYLKAKFNFKHLMFIHDPYPLNQYPPPYQKKNSLPYKSVARLFGKVLKSADMLSFPSLRLMEWMAEFYPHTKQKFVIQPHIGLTLEELYSNLPNTIESKLPDFPEGVNIVHTGTLLGPRNPSFLIDALQKLFSNIPDTQNLFHLHIIGKMNKTWQANRLISKNVHIHSSRVSYLESLEIQQSADILLIIEAVSEVSPFMPGKLADYLVAKKPILALTPKASETTRILKEDYPLLAKNGDVDEIYEKLVILYKAYFNQTLKTLIPSPKCLDYVRPENWINQLEKIKP